MNSFEEQADPAPLAVRRAPPSLRLAAVALLLTAVVGAVLTWGDGWAVPAASSGGYAPAFRYVNSGWISPQDAEEAGPFSEDLRAFVILSQPELEAFENSYEGKATRGNAATLGRIDFDRAALLAAYYVWRPVRGDPLTVTGVRVKGGNAVVDLELSYDPQGREYPYMYAPMVMVAVERSLFPQGEPMEFVFHLNGEPTVTLTATPNPG